jgi:enoyl-CoA hydratase/carnithine racemase
MSAVHVPAAFVRVTTQDGVSGITWSRPERRNAIGAQVSDELTSALGSVAQRDDVHVVVLSAQEPPFCAGWDVTDFRSLGGADPAALRDFFGHGRALLAALSNVPQLVVAAVRGAALGFGCALLSRCDVVIAADDAVFGLPEVGLGMPPATALPELLSVMSPRTVLHWAATGERYDAQRARLDGLVTDVVPAQDLDGVVSAMARRLADHPDSAVRVTKRLVGQMSGLPLDRRVAVGVESAVGRFAQQVQP